MGLESIALRPWGPEDVDGLPALANNRRVWRNLTDRFPHPYRHSDAVEWVGVANHDPGEARNFAVLYEGEVVGGAGWERLKDLGRRTAEVGYWLGEPFWGRGIATRALGLLTDMIFREEDFVRLQAGVIAWNAASCRVLEKAGYSREARLRQQIWKDGEIGDLLLYALLREEYRAA